MITPRYRKSFKRTGLAMAYASFGTILGNIISALIASRRRKEYLAAVSLAEFQKVLAFALRSSTTEWRRTLNSATGAHTFDVRRFLDNLPTDVLHLITALNANPWMALDWGSYVAEELTATTFPETWQATHGAGPGIATWASNYSPAPTLDAVIAACPDGYTLHPLSTVSRSVACVLYVVDRVSWDLSLIPKIASEGDFTRGESGLGPFNIQAHEIEHLVATTILYGLALSNAIVGVQRPLYDARAALALELSIRGSSAVEKLQAEIGAAAELPVHPLLAKVGQALLPTTIETTLGDMPLMFSVTRWLNERELPTLNGLPAAPARPGITVKPEQVTNHLASGFSRIAQALKMKEKDANEIKWAVWTDEKAQYISIPAYMELLRSEKGFLDMLRQQAAILAWTKMPASGTNIVGELTARWTNPIFSDGALFSAPPRAGALGFRPVLPAAHYAWTTMSEMDLGNWNGVSTAQFLYWPVPIKGEVDAGIGPAHVETLYRPEAAIWGGEGRLKLAHLATAAMGDEVAAAAVNHYKASLAAAGVPDETSEDKAKRLESAKSTKAYATWDYRNPTVVELATDAGGLPSTRIYQTSWNPIAVSATSGYEAASQFAIAFPSRMLPIGELMFYRSMEEGGFPCLFLSKRCWDGTAVIWSNEGYPYGRTKPQFTVSFDGEEPELPDAISQLDELKDFAFPSKLRMRPEFDDASKTDESKK